MIYEVAQDLIDPHNWRVEAIHHDGDGEVYIAIFSGPDAQARAEAYAAWKSVITAELRYQAITPPKGSERTLVRASSAKVSARLLCHQAPDAHRIHIISGAFRNLAAELACLWRGPE